MVRVCVTPLWLGLFTGNIKRSCGRVSSLERRGSARQEAVFGRWAWLANGAGWSLFHVAFGGAVFVALWPILFILPYVVQRRRNTWIGVIVHASPNGPGFLAVAFGLT